MHPSKMICRVAALMALLSCCAPAPDANGLRDEATTDAELSDPNGPIAQGEADVTSLTAEQIDVMFAAAFEQAAPFEEHSVMCLAMATEASKRRRNPPQAALESFRQFTALPVLPASECAFDVFPHVIDNRARAMLYTVIVEPWRRGEPVTFWAHATYGNQGANGAKFTLRRGLRGWYADFTGVTSIS